MANFKRGFSNQSPASAKIWWQAAPINAYTIAIPYNEVWIAAFKQLIPGDKKHWDPVAKVWYFDEAFLDPVKFLLTKSFPGIILNILTRQQVEAAGQPRASALSGHLALSVADAAILEFFKMLPFEAARKAYLAAITLAHPDKGGNAEGASRLNSAWQKIEKEVFGK